MQNTFRFVRGLCNFSKAKKDIRSFGHRGLHMDICTVVIEDFDWTFVWTFL